MSQPTQTAPEKLANVPVGFFTVSMGLFGLALAFQAGGFPIPFWAVATLGALVLLVLFAVQTLRAIRHPEALKAEWAHPVKMAFFPAASISVMLLATAIHELSPDIARPIWVLGAAAQGVLTLLVISTWISARAFGPGQLSPAWFIPAVGNVMAPLAGVPLGYHEISWYFFAVGILFWVVLLTLVFNRLIFHDPMPERLRPTIVILVAPPALAFVSWVTFHGNEIDAGARILINLGYFFTALVAIQLPALLRLPFSLSFWALSFPLAAITVASFRFAEIANSTPHLVAAYGLLSALTVTIAVLSVRTIRIVLSGAVFQPD